MEKLIQIAIDGPAAAGKSTIAKIVAEELGFVYVDTGAMYRAITWATLNTGIELEKEKEVANLLDEIEIKLAPGGKVFVNDVDVTEEIRATIVTNAVSQIATYEAIRVEMKHRQALLAESASVIMDGRDIGTNVLPNANFKFFMIADPRVRAKRRYEENIARGIPADIDALEQEISERDTMDANRKHAPLLQADDAILIDTSYMTIDEVVAEIVNTVKGA